MEFLVHALVVPARDHKEAERFDAEVEVFAVQVAAAHEERSAAEVKDVSRPDQARQAGLSDWPGFDLLSDHPDGERRCIEVKGRAAAGSVEVTDNEWAKACNLRDQLALRRLRLRHPAPAPDARARPVRQAAHTEPRIACVHRYTGSRPGGGRINPKERYMGATHVTVTIRNPAEPDRTWEALFLVDTGATDCLVPRPYLEGIGLQSRGQRVYELADGSEIKVDITVAEIEFMGEIVGGTIIFGEPGAEPLLGVTALESVGIEVDPTNQRLKRLPAVRLKRQLRR